MEVKGPQEVVGGWKPDGAEFSRKKERVIVVAYPRETDPRLCSAAVGGSVVTCVRQWLTGHNGHHIWREVPRQRSDVEIPKGSSQFPVLEIFAAMHLSTNS